MSELDSAMQPRRALSGPLWLLLFVAFALWTAWRLGAFDLWAIVTTPAGDSVRFPNTFATVDHPFHATRAETLRRSLGDGDILRWIGNHQGGYPVEFYPLGAAWMEVIVWALALGSLPVMAIHKLVVIAVYLLPVAGFAALARYGRVPWSVPLLAIVMHICVRGWWWSGGYMELIEWGLLTNVASAALLPLALAWQRGYFRSWRPALLAGASAIASVAIYTNVRSILPLAAILAGCAIDALIVSRGKNMRRVVTGSLSTAGLAALLVAPLVVSLLRFEDLYVFVRYSSYADLRAYWESSIQAVSAPVMILAILGAVVALRLRRDDGARTVLIVLALYVAGTAATIVSGAASDAISQLETTRLMPFQRLLVIYLAAYGTWSVVEAILRRARNPFPKLQDAAMVIIGLLFIATYILGWIPGIPESDRASGPIVTTGSPAFVELRDAVEQADAATPPGTAILVLGGVVSWHDQLWAPQWSDRRYFYDDWLWYWQTDHVGDYDPERSHAYDEDSSALTDSYLRQHAIGAVIVTGSAAPNAAASPLLTQEQSGTWSWYLVDDPVPILTAAGSELLEPGIENERLQGVASSPQGTFEVRHNWFPRWQATVDGEGASIEKDDAGYMFVTADAPGTRLVLTYRVDRWDWLARVALLAGVVATVLLLLASTRKTKFRILLRQGTEGSAGQG